MGEFFTNVVGLGYDDEEEARELFSLLLLKPGSRYITYEDIHFLQCWEESKQATQHRQRLRKSWMNKDPFLRGNVTIAGMNYDSDDFSQMVALDADHDKQKFKD